jgi:hypothetical protein
VYGGLYRSTLPLNVEGALMNNRKDAKKRPHSMCTLRWARHPRKDGSERCAMKMTKRLKKATSPIVERRKINP